MLTIIFFTSSFFCVDYAIRCVLCVDTDAMWGTSCVELVWSSASLDAVVIHGYSFDTVAVMHENSSGVFEQAMLRRPVRLHTCCVCRELWRFVARHGETLRTTSRWFLPGPQCEVPKWLLCPPTIATSTLWILCAIHGVQRGT